MNRDDVGVRQRGRGPRLAAAAFHGARGLDTIAQQLDRDDAVQLQVAGGIDRAHAAVAEATLDGIPLCEHPRRVGQRQRRAIRAAARRAGRIRRATRFALLDRGRLRKRSSEVHRDRREQVAILAAVRLLGSLDAERQQSLHPVAGPRHANEQFRSAFGERSALLVRQLVEYRARSVPSHDQRLSEHREQSNGLVIRPETHARVVRRRARDGLVRTAFLRPDEQGHVGRMQGRFDAAHDSRRELSELGRPLEIFGELPKEALGAVVLPEVLPVERVQPSLAAVMDPRRGAHERGIPPEVIANHVAHRRFGMAEHVGDERHRRRRDEQEQHTAGERILQPPPEHQADVEEPMPEDGVGERKRHQKNRQHPRRQAPRREHAGAKVGARREQVERDHAGRGRASHPGSRRARA